MRSAKGPDLWWWKASRASTLKLDGLPTKYRYFLDQPRQSLGGSCRSSNLLMEHRRLITDDLFLLPRSSAPDQPRDSGAQYCKLGPSSPLRSPGRSHESERGGVNLNSPSPSKSIFWFDAQGSRILTKPGDSEQTHVSTSRASRLSKHKQMSALALMK